MTQRNTYLTPVDTFYTAKVHTSYIAKYPVEIGNFRDHLLQMQTKDHALIMTRYTLSKCSLVLK